MACSFLSIKMWLHSKNKVLGFFFLYWCLMILIVWGQFPYASLHPCWTVRWHVAVRGPRVSVHRAIQVVVSFVRRVSASENFPSQGSGSALTGTSSLSKGQRGHSLSMAFGYYRALSPRNRRPGPAVAHIIEAVTVSGVTGTPFRTCLWERPDHNEP